jgi:hypothetical protein
MADAGEATPAATGRVRLVNLWPDDKKPGTVDLYVSRGLGNLVPLFTNVGFGEVTQAAAVEAEAVVFAYRSGGQDVGNGARSPDFIASETLRGDLETGHPLTLVIFYSKPLRDGGPSAYISAYRDAGDTLTGSMPAKSVSGARLVTDVGGVSRLVGERKAYQFGIPGKGCLHPAGASPRPGMTVTVAGTATAEYDVPPGSAKIAGYDGRNSKCTGPPTLAAVDVDADASRRNYLFAYGTGPDDLRLLFVPGLPK